MKYLLDADWAISFLNGRKEAVDLVTELADEGIALSIIAWGEIYEGLLVGGLGDHRLGQFEGFTNALDLIPPDIDVVRRYARIRVHLRSEGQLLPDNDLWIAATALAYGLTLVSRDQHFFRIPDLVLYQQG
ncbi:MAG: type II toxin-antitoxin system VapC family toxin [Chloroflexi bacterium]|nr:type II toxin-antitoxin system VapC family toxin [Chloroflexota bacterium]